MDPKSSQLDPKFKEIYERVMGTGQPSTPSPSQPPKAPDSTPPPPPIPQPMQTAPANQQKKKISKPLLILAAVTFLIVYTLIWILVFQP